MQRLNAASCLLLAFLFGAAVCLAAEHVQVQVVQTHTGIRLGFGGVEGDPALSRCNGTSGRYSRELGFYCWDSALAPPALGQTLSEYAFFYDVRVVMPNADRILYHCSTILNADCQGFPAFPESTVVVCSDFVYAGRAYKDCTATGPTAEGIGVYRAAFHGDRMTIFGPHWRRNYLQYGTWQLGTVAAQDPKPAPPQETKPAAPPDSKPTPPDPNAAAPPDATPAATGTATAESKDDNPPVPRLSPTLAVEQVVDPRVIEQAKAGDPVAQYKLGYDYFLGRGVPLDYVQAAIWWRKAADQGYPEAQNNLGVLYNAGKGVPQSFAEAYFWQNLAAARVSGSLQVQFAKNRDESASKLWLLSRLKVQQRAAKWAADHPVPARTHEPPPEEKRGEYP